MRSPGAFSFYEFREGILIALRAIRANKLRSVLTTLGIVIGVGTVSMMGSTINGLNNAFYDSLSMLGPDVLFIQKYQWGSGEDWWKVRNRRDITMRDANRLMREASSALAVLVEAGTMRPIRSGNRSAVAAFVSGNNESGAVVRGWTLKQGRFLSAEEVAGGRAVCVLGSGLAERLFAKESPLGKKIHIGSARSEVVGVMDKIGGFFFGQMDNQVILPITKFLAEYAWRPHVEISVKIKPDVGLEDAKEELRGIMRKIRRLGPGERDDFAINQQDLIIQQFNRVGGTIAAGGLFLTSLSLFVGGIGIMNIMFVSVIERTREIGLRKALGARRRSILFQFLIESLALCLLGGFIGVLIAFGGTRLLQKQAEFPAEMSVTVVAVGLGVSMLTGLAAGFFPARRASLMSPVEALRQE